ncbi:MAG TPA: transglycosylase SLT domain-containing protein [Streptosporangiaceae bacterium]|nr:transglycosylase SLT domain-containing protein [Streptosporangiaceae bacterium]
MCVTAAVGLASAGAVSGNAATGDVFRSPASQTVATANVSYLGPGRMLDLARGESSLQAMQQQSRADRQAAERLADKRAQRRAAQRAAAQAAATQQASQAQQAAAPAPPPVAQPSGNPQQIALGMLGSYGWSGQFGCLQALWNRESGWNPTASNPDGAYGIPQALPGSKMASAGPDWQTNPATQIRWGLGYIRSTYGSPCAAWSHEEATGWY